jgi:hypothetical protein
VDQLCGEEPRDDLNNPYGLVEQAFQKLTAGEDPADAKLKDWLPRWLDNHHPGSPPRAGP